MNYVIAHRVPLTRGVLFLVGFLIGFLITLAVLSSRSQEQEVVCGLLGCNSLESLLSFAREAMLLMLPWPLVVVVIFFSIGPSRLVRSINSLVVRIRRVSFGEGSIELSSEGRAAIELDARRFKAEVQAYRFAVLQESSRLARRYRVREKLQQLLPANVGDSVWNECPVAPLAEWRSKIRLTIHVPDFVFADRLVQLVDYVGKGSAGTAGRTFSMRQGIIGKVWRGRSPILENNLTGEGGKPDEEIIRKIVQDWGMTEEEAYNAKKYPAYLAVPIFRFVQKDNVRQASTDIIGILYLDSGERNIFKYSDANAEFVKRLEQWFNERLLNTGIIDAVSEIQAKMKEYDPDISLAL